MTARAVRERRTLCIAAAAFAALAAGLVALSPAPTGVFWDDAVYVITAKALATGHGYHYINLPGAPAATHFPPLWPALLSLVWRVAPNFPENVRWMKLLNPLLLACGAASVALLGIRVARLPAWLAATLAAATIIVAPSLLTSAVLMSEPLGLALAAPALVAATTLVMRGHMKDAMWAGVLVGLAILARSAAIVLLPSLAVGLLWRRTRAPSAVALGIALALVAPWFVWSGAHAHELGPALIGSFGPYSAWAVNGYRADPSLLPAVIARNASTMYAEVGLTSFYLLQGAMRVVRSPLLVVLLLFSAAGWTLCGRRVLPLLVALAGYLALVLAWPYAPGRFVWAFFSLYAVAVAAAVTAMLRHARRAHKWRVPAAAAATLGVTALCGVAWYDVTGFRLGWQHTAIDANAGHLAEAVHIIDQVVPKGDLIATDVELSTYLYTGRVAIPLSMLTVGEYLHAKTPEQVRTEFLAIDSTFRPRWWIASGMVPARFDLRKWGADTASHLVLIAQMPNDGVATRVHGR